MSEFESKSKQVGSPVLAPLAPEPAHMNPKLRLHHLNLIASTLLTRDAMSEADQDRIIAMAVAALDALAPRDEVEGMLCVQMIAAHNAALGCLRRVAEDRPTRNVDVMHAGKLLMLYLKQAEALDRHRGTLPQVTVGSVTIEPGAQAIVGHVTTERR